MVVFFKFSLKKSKLLKFSGKIYPNKYTLAEKNGRVLKKKISWKSVNLRKLKEGTELQGA